MNTVISMGLLIDVIVLSVIQSDGRFVNGYLLVTRIYISLRLFSTTFVTTHAIVKEYLDKLFLVNFSHFVSWNMLDDT